MNADFCEICVLPFTLRDPKKGDSSLAFGMT